MDGAATGGDSASPRRAEIADVTEDDLPARLRSIQQVDLLEIVTFAGPTAAAILDLTNGEPSGHGTQTTDW
jgi:hypothetical protein